MQHLIDIHQAALDCVMTEDAHDKVRKTHLTVTAWEQGKLMPSETSSAPVPIPQPGRPSHPELVAPGRVPKRGVNSPQQRAALVHALAHIEFNAINLAWDVVYRFRGLPRAFYDDWITVAADEARHFTMLRGRLRELDHDYGDFAAHNGLWQAAVHTSHDLLARMALVPRVLEARGLDVTGEICLRLRRAGDSVTADMVATIEQEEVAHVRAGTRWFRHGCAQAGLEPHATFFNLIDRFAQGRIKGPFNREARLRAGFTLQELEELERRFSQHLLKRS